MSLGVQVLLSNPCGPGNRAAYALPAAPSSLGGWPSPIPLRPERYPLMVPDPPGLIPFGPSHLYRVFPDQYPADRTAGKIDYCCIWLNATSSSVGTVAVTVSGTASTVGSVMFWQDTAAVDGSVQRIASPTTAPAGASWSGPSTFTVPGIWTAGSPVPIWLRRTLPALSAAMPYDAILISIMDGTVPAFDGYLYWRRPLGTLTSGSVTGAHDGQIVTRTSGEVFTVSAFAGAVATDPAGNYVTMYDSTTFYDDHSFEPVFGLPLNQATGQFYQPAVRTAAGVYRVEWHPLRCGHHQLSFDLGGEIRLDRSVEVSPIQ